MNSIRILILRILIFWRGNPEVWLLNTRIDASFNYSRLPHTNNMNVAQSISGISRTALRRYTSSHSKHKYISRLVGVWRGEMAFTNWYVLRIYKPLLKEFDILDIFFRSLASIECYEFVQSIIMCNVCWQPNYARSY